MGGEDGGTFSLSSSSSAAFLFLDADDSRNPSPSSDGGLESIPLLIESSISLFPDLGSSTASRCCTICNKLGCLALLLKPDICKNDGVACARDPGGGCAGRGEDVCMCSSNPSIDFAGGGLSALTLPEM